MKSKICAIHQPNFFPWLGYFDKIRKCDKFVILDSVQYPKTGGVWSNRVTLNIQGKSKWVTAPINRLAGLRNINEVSFRDENWRIKFIKTLQANYVKTPFYKEHKEFVFELINFSNNDITTYNINAITQICKLLNIDIKDKLVLSSSYDFKSSSNQLLVDLTKKVDCDTYMAGGGADGYQDIKIFENNNINFIYQNFDHPIYTQSKIDNCIKGLSVIDYIFNCGNVLYEDIK